MEKTSNGLNQIILPKQQLSRKLPNIFLMKARKLVALLKLEVY